MAAFLEVLSVVGARPQFIKLAPVARALERIGGVTHRIVHTGQHYDDAMSAVFFDQLGLPAPELNLGAGSGTHGAQTATMLSGLETCLLDRPPGAVLVYGDTNSTLAATLAASKLQVPVAHVESGLRSFDRTMPEELNRIVTDHCSDRLYAPTGLAMQNLARENLAERSVRTGDVMRDAVVAHHAIAMESSRALDELGLSVERFALLTVHRAANTTPEVLQTLVQSLCDVADGEFRILFPVHPRTRAALGDAIEQKFPALTIIDPLPYFDLLQVLAAAALVITDSGGLQKEAAFLRTPCITIREETEWGETVQMGVNRLVGRDPERLRAAVAAYRDGPDPFTEAVSSEMDVQYGEGQAAVRLCEDLVDWMSNASLRA